MKGFQEVSNLRQVHLSQPQRTWHRNIGIGKAEREPEDERVLNDGRQGGEGIEHGFVPDAG